MMRCWSNACGGEPRLVVRMTGQACVQVHAATRLAEIAPGCRDTDVICRRVGRRWTCRCSRGRLQKMVAGRRPHLDTLIGEATNSYLYTSLLALLVLLVRIDQTAWHGDLDDSFCDVAFLPSHRSAPVFALGFTSSKRPDGGDRSHALLVTPRYSRCVVASTLSSANAPSAFLTSSAFMRT